MRQPGRRRKSMIVNARSEGGTAKSAKDRLERLGP